MGDLDGTEEMLDIASDTTRFGGLCASAARIPASTMDGTTGNADVAARSAATDDGKARPLEAVGPLSFLF